MSVCAAPSPRVDGDADVVLGIPIDEATDSASALLASGTTASSSSMSSSFAGSSSIASAPTSARLTLSQRATHARSLVRSSQAFVVFGGYLRLRESSREWRMKTWYCSLLRAQLYFYATKRDASRATNLVQRVTVAAQSAVASNGQGLFHTYKHAFTFRTTRGAEYFCSASSDSERALWLEQLAHAGAADDAKDETGNDSVHSGTTGDDDELDATASAEPGSASRHDSLDSLDGLSLALRTLPSDDAATFLLTTGSFPEGSLTNRTGGCFACGAAFGLLRNQRRTCKSCARHFCRAHCSQYAAGVDTAECDAPVSSSSVSSSSSSSISSASVAPLSSSSTSRARSRVCDPCSHRQHFISFLETFTATAIRLMRHDNVNVASAAPSTAEGDNDRYYAALHKELAIIVASATSYTVLNVLCLLKKYAHVPWMFTRALCLLLPLYERNPAALEEYWTQFLVLYVPLLELKDPFSPSMQFFLRFVSAVCRRSNAFALRTVWECLAFSEDARVQGDRLTMSYLTLLMIACSSFDGGSSYVLRKLLVHAPRAQVDAITTSLKDFLGIRSVIREEIPKSLSAKWFNALCKHETSVAKQLVLGAADGLGENPELVLRVFDPAQTDYLAVLTDHGVRLPEGATLGDEHDECEFEEEDSAFMHQQEREFDAQAAFVEQLTLISDRLRHVQPVEKRSEVLQQQLLTLEKQHLARDSVNEGGVAIHAPLLGSGGGTMLDKLRLLRVVVDEAKVFSTRSRAPALMVFEACPVTGATRPLAATLHETIIRGIPVNPEEDGDDADDDLLDGELVMSAQLVSMRLRATSRTAVAHKDSVMLDALLCGNDETTTTTTTTSSSSRSSDADDPRSGSRDDNGPPPDELLVQEARETYEDSTLGHFMASFRGGGSSAARSTWKRAIRAKSPFRDVKGWTVVSLIAKSHDDLRQEVFAMQLMRNLVEIFENNELHRLYLRPYEILCTGANVGLIETLTDSQSVDAVKKEYGSLHEYFAAQFGSPSSSRYQAAQNAFITSMAASSLYCYLFQIKDRHNGNIMIDQRGHIMHIDFGFMMGSAPGGAFSLEDAPFKLTREMVDIMGGLDSRGYQDFAELFKDGFLAVRREYIKIVTLLHLTAQNSPYPCFQNTSPRFILRGFRERLFLSDSDDVARSKIRRLVDKSYNHWGTRQYDRFQHSSNGIMP